ncbi:testis-expressed protein 47-like [Brachyhypopomus gauderio]|uniref:testis-expressed protein 47-like n=1 Tax=Brachyhypopomus gauderio TaxID=698409 RepID=UPI0040434626
MADSHLPAGNLNPYFNAYENSLFAEVKEQKTKHKKCFIHRLLCVATINQTTNIPEDTRIAVIEYYKMFISKCQKKMHTEGVTGILLVYPKCIVHVLESSSEVLTLILKDLSDMGEVSNSLLKDSRILTISHCILSRMFPSWEYQILNLPVSLKDASPQTQPVEALVSNSLAVIYRFCVCLLKSMGEKPDTQELPCLVEEETIILLCQNGELQSPTSFLQIYTKPVNILLDSEIVWPTHQLYW